MKNKKKRNKLMLLLILLLAISIGFAALATTLKINGTTNIGKNTWDVYWENKAVNPDGVSQTPPTLSAESGKTALTIATWSATLNAPGDFYEFTINAVNNGTLDAMVGVDGVVTTYEANNENTPSTLPNYIVYSVTYEDGTAIAPYHLLAKKTGNTPTKEAYKVRIEFTNDITPTQMNTIPEGGYSYTFNTQAQYVQADDNAIDLHPASLNQYWTTFNGTYGYDFTGAQTINNGGNTEWVSILDSNSTAYYLRYDGTKIETCAVFSNGTVCLEPNQWDSSNVGSCDSYYSNCTAEGYVAAKKAEFEAKGAECILMASQLYCYETGVECDINNNGSVDCGSDSDVYWAVNSDGSATGHNAP